MHLSTLVATNALLVSANAAQLLTDINKIQKYWGEITPYADNEENYFGVEHVGLPEGCQVVRIRVDYLYANWPANNLQGIGASPPEACPAFSNHLRG